MTITEERAFVRTLGFFFGMFVAGMCAGVLFKANTATATKPAIVCKDIGWLDVPEVTYKNDPTRAEFIAFTANGDALYRATVPTGAKSLSIRVNGADSIGSIHIEGTP